MFPARDIFQILRDLRLPERCIESEASENSLVRLGTVHTHCSFETSLANNDRCFLDEVCPTAWIASLQRENVSFVHEIAPVKLIVL